MAAALARILRLVPAIAGGCVSVVTPPPAPDRETTVFVLQEAMHLGLVLPLPEGGYVEFGFGDYEWFALGNTAWYRVFPTVLWPTQGTLGRRPFPLAEAQLPATLSWARLSPIPVDAARAELLRQRLEQEFAAAFPDGPPPPEDFRFTFARHADDYWLPYNCSDATAGWLRELGCAVAWVPLRRGLSVGSRR